MAQSQVALRPGDADEEQPTLFFEFGIVLRGPRVREESLFEANDEDDREFEPLRGVEGHQRDGSALVFPAVDRGAERDIGEEVEDGRLGMFQVELSGGRHEFIEVGDPVFSFPLWLVGPVVPITTKYHELSCQLLSRGAIAEGREFVHEQGEIAKA